MKTIVAEKTLDRICDHLVSNPGSGICETAEAIGRCNTSASVGLNILIERGVVFKGVQKRSLKDGGLSDNLTPGYYWEG